MRFHPTGYALVWLTDSSAVEMSLWWVTTFWFYFSCLFLMLHAKICGQDNVRKLFFCCLPTMSQFHLKSSTHHKVVFFLWEKVPIYFLPCVVSKFLTQWRLLFLHCICLASVLKIDMYKTHFQASGPLFSVIFLIPIHTALLTINALNTFWNQGMYCIQLCFSCYGLLWYLVGLASHFHIFLIWDYTESVHQLGLWVI